MEGIFDKIMDFLINTFSTLGPLFGIFIIIVESILPFLPLAAFLSLNAIVFGPVIGFLINWFATCLGCLLSYYAFKLGFSDKLYRHIKIDGKLSGFLNRTSKLSFPNLVLLIAMPFTPAFAVNIAAGLAKMNTRKFVLAILIGKPFIIYFWSYVGTTLMQSITDIHAIIRILALLIIAYAVSKLIQLKLKIKE